MPGAVSSPPAATLVFSWGNPSRGDDALGPLAYRWLRELKLPGVDCLTDYQLQIEHSLDLAGRQRVVFVDASLSAAAPFEYAPVIAYPDHSYTSHALSPASLLAVYRQVREEAPPPAWLLSIRGYRFDLGAALSYRARNNLDQALAFIRLELAGIAA